MSTAGSVNCWPLTDSELALNGWERTCRTSTMRTRGGILGPSSPVSPEGHWATGRPPQVTKQDSSCRLSETEASRYRQRFWNATVPAQLTLLPTARSVTNK
jgi:hypothetical protein